MGISTSLSAVIGLDFAFVHKQTNRGQMEMKRVKCLIDYSPCCLEDFLQNLIAKKTKSPVIITPIGISELLLSAMSESEDANILNVS